MKTFGHSRRSYLAKWYTWFVLLGAFLTLVLAANSASAIPPGTLPFGVYDPDGSYAQDSDVSIEHIFMPWDGVDLKSLDTADAYARERNRSLLVTVEPWIWGAAEAPDVLRHNILAGHHDTKMRTVCSMIASLQSSVTLRWAQEMDNPNGHFPWAMWRPTDYIDAYTRMVDICRSVAPEVRFMWSPTGEEGMQAYYPGDNVVDVVGVSVFGAQDYQRQQFGTEYGFVEVLGPRYERALTFGKPIMVAELGYVGDLAYRTEWNDSVRQKHRAFPALTAVVYFNRQEVFPWPHDFGLPDWREGTRLGE